LDVSINMLPPTVVTEHGLENQINIISEPVLGKLRASVLE